MLPAELNITAEAKEIEIIVDSRIPETNVILNSFPDVIILSSGNMGPQGPVGASGQWVALTQADYDALDPPDPEILYVIVV